MEKKMKTPEELTKISNKVLTLLVSELGDEEQTLVPSDMMCVLAVVHRTVFANIEKQKGIDKAREETEFLLKLVNFTMEEGAWDEENQCIK
jgi:hypothetical protein